MRSIILLLASFVCFGKDLYYTNNSTLNVPIGRDGAYIFFDEDVKEINKNLFFKISRAVNSKSKDYKSYLVKWKRGSESEEIRFLLVNRKTVTLRFHYMGNNSLIKTDNEYSLIRKMKRVNGKRESTNIQAISLLKSIMKKELVPNYKAYNRDYMIKDGKENVWTKLKGVYIGNDLVGYIFNIDNKGDSTYYFDDKKLKIGNPDYGIIHAIGTNKIEPKSSTELYLVAHKTSLLIMRDSKRRRNFGIHLEEVKQ